ncbi:hypothetical protein [Sphingobacterium sp. SGG-5]|uniref:hypothetical protein n=1 Tax=Sphingobacterium sp. SGG-5 TaxID=2710881 RepID=UPI001F0E0E5C|nr:hypothetical protein [Sphingobacterium sp. SGG-5]
MISLVAWMLIAISNKYTFVVKSSIEYVNIPEKKAFHPLQADTVQVSLKMTGWNVLLSKMKPTVSKIQVDLSTLASRNFIVFSSQLGFINRQFPADKQVVRVSPDTLYFDFSSQTQRKVEIRVPTNISFKKQYGIIGQTQTNPQHVTVTGPSEDVQYIDYLETDTVYGTDVHTDIRTVVNINRKQRTNITIHPAVAEVTIPVGELTEKQIEVPLHVRHSSPYTSVRIIPSKVTITALVSLKDYGKWTARDFEAVVDLDNWTKNQVKSLPVQLIKAPEFCEVVRIEPQNIDFFVRK